MTKRDEKSREKLLPFKKNVRMGVMQFFLSKREEKCREKLLPFEKNVHIGVMRRARAKEMALAMSPAPKRDGARDDTRPQKGMKLAMSSAKRITPC